MNDLPVIEKIDPTKSDIFILPSSVVRIDSITKENTGIAMQTDFWIKNHERLGGIKNKSCYFDAGFTGQQHLKFPIIYPNQSTFETILHLLGMAGFEKVFTNGIDYSIEYNPLFGVRDSGTSFLGMKHEVENISEKYGISIIKLSGPEEV